MNALQNNYVYSFFSNEDDARAIENATRAAIKAVLNVFWTINNNKMKEYQRSVAEKGRENEMLRIRMESAERELVTLRQFKYSLEQCGLNSDADGVHAPDSCRSAGENVKQRVVPFLHEKEKEVVSEGAWKRDNMSPCEGTYFDARPKEMEVIACRWGSPAAMDFNHKVPSERTASPSTYEGQPAGQPECDSILTITKVEEEPPDYQSLYIKSEMSEESVRSVECEHYPGPPPFAPLSQYRRGDPLAVGTQNISFRLFEQPGMAASAFSPIKPLSNKERGQRYRAKLRADPERQRVYREKDRNRQRIRRKLISNLPELSQELKREYSRQANKRPYTWKKISASR